METCGRCGEEIRFGTRDGVTKFWHRGPVDHEPAHGRAWTPEDTARQQALLDQLRVRPVGEPEDGVQRIAFYTVRRFGLKGDAAKAYDALNAPEEAVLPPVEVWCHPVDPADPITPSGARTLAALVSGVTRVTPGGKTSKSLKHPPMAPGWELRRLTHARGPYVGASGECLSVSDVVVLGARGPEVDGGYRIAVASWRDGKFDFAWTGVVKDGTAHTEQANSDALKAFIKESPCHQPPAPTEPTTPTTGSSGQTGSSTPTRTS